MKIIDNSAGTKIELNFSLTHWILGVTWDTVSILSGMVHFVAIHFGPWSVIISWPAHTAKEA